ACHVFTEKLVEGLEADEARCAELIEGALAMCTSLVPAIGYDKSAALAKAAYAEGKTVRQLALEQKVLPEAELNRLLDPMSMTEPGGEGGSAGGYPPRSSRFPTFRLVSRQRGLHPPPFVVDSLPGRPRSRRPAATIHTEPGMKPAT